MKGKLIYKLLLFLGISFLLFSFVYNMYRHSELHLKKHGVYISQKIQSELNTVQQLSQTPTFNASFHSKKRLFDYLNSVHLAPDISLFVFDKEQQLIYWSTNKYNPSNIDLNKYKKVEGLIKINRDYQIIKAFDLQDEYQLVTLITLYKGFPVENKYLKSEFSFGSKNFSDLMLTEEKDSTTFSTAILSSTQQPLFYIKNNLLSEQSPLWTIVFLEIVGIIFIFIFFNEQLEKTLVEDKKLQAVLYSLIYIFFIEIYIDILHIPTFTSYGDLFLPDSYASPYLSDSIGGLFLKMHLIHWLIRHWLKPIRLFFEKRGHTFGDIFFSAFAVSAFYLLVFVIVSLHKNSNISLDLNKINQLRLDSFVALFIICFATGIMAMTAHYSKNNQSHPFQLFIFQLFFNLGFIALGYQIHFIEISSFALLLVLLYFSQRWLIDFILSQKNIFGQSGLIGNLLLLSIYSFIVTIILLHYTNERKINLLQYYAVNLASERDYAEEFEMTQIADSIQKDNFIKSYFENPFSISFDIDWRVRQKYFSKLSNKFDISILSYSSDKIQLKGEENKSFSSLDNIIHQDDVEIISPSVYYMSAKPKGEKYLMSLSYLQDEHEIGYLFIIFTPKDFTPYSAYPELLSTENNSLFNIYNSNLNYGIYNKNELITTSGNFAYSDKYDFPTFTDTDFLKIKNKGYYHLVYQIGDKKIVVSYSQANLMGVLAYFSILLIILSVYFYSLSVISDNDFSLLSGKRIKDLLLMNTFQKQIQVSMLSQVLFSLVLVGLMTLFFFDIQYNHFHNDGLRRRGASVVESIGDIYQENFLNTEDVDKDQIISNKIRRLSEIFRIDMNIYDLNGKLTFTSQPEIFKTGIQSNLISPNAFDALHIDGLSSFIQNERIEKLKYTAAYLPLKNAHSKIVGYINFPYYGKERNIKNDISFFLVSLINIYVLLIIISSLISLWVSNTIVNPLRIITDSIRNVELGKKNQHIVWKNNDEIGYLVNQYNQMIDVLDKSAELLAKSEREGAWKEMAKQVAHEIKNPLTPMKLSVQFLQRKLDEKSEDLEEVTQSVSERLIEQIDTLANIATAFSDFAKMPFTNKSNENIISILKNVIGLFNSDENVEIESDIPDEKIITFVDKEQMTRVFTNLIKNAIQSVPEERNASLQVRVSNQADTCIIAIKDNGVGIPKEREEDIFEPNFTTKSSGSGLGLAMSKSIIDSMDGKIWFESVLQQGTTFFIELKKV
ncbi:MAG: ATP-binding protein [Chitinophagales bacterium]|nr:ATP-binding protein [Chitinophagales bacterium]